MRRDLPVLAVLLGTGIASFQPCLAAAADRTKHLTFSASGGYQTYAMSDVNRAIESTLAAYTGARAHKNKIKGGPGFGGTLRIWPSDRAFASLEFQRLLASNSGSGSYLGSTYNVDLDVPASSVTISAGYVPRAGASLRYGLGAGVGYYVTTGRIVTTGPGANTAIAATGIQKAQRAIAVRRARRVSQPLRIRYPDSQPPPTLPKSAMR